MLALCGACRSAPPPAAPAAELRLAEALYDVHAVDQRRAVAVGYGGTILLTADGGATWTQPPSGTERALYSVHFVDAAQGWIAGQGGVLLHTTDGGISWQAQESGTSLSLFAVFFLDSQHGWVVGERSVLLVTRDGGRRWEIRAIALQQSVSREAAIPSTDPVLYDVRFVSPDSGWVVGEFGKILHTRDGGVSWLPQETSLLGRDGFDVLDLPAFVGVTFAGEEKGLVTGLDGRLVRTEDAGATWLIEPIAVPGEFLGPLFSPALLPDGSAWAVAANGDLLRRRRDDGVWEILDPLLPIRTWLRGMSWLDDQEGWAVGGYGQILRTSDGGQTWSAVVSDQ